MGKTNAERQREYRRRHLVDGTRTRREFVLEAHADMALDRLARHCQLPVTAIVQRIIIDAERAATEDMTRAQLNRYFADQMKEEHSAEPRVASRELAKAQRRRRGRGR